MLLLLASFTSLLTSLIALALLVALGAPAALIGAALLLGAYATGMLVIARNALDADRS